MSAAVLDASVLVAAVSPAELHHAAARAALDAQPLDSPFVVPAIFGVEVMAALARRGEPDALLDALGALISGPRFHPVPIDAALLERATRVARLARVRAYDALYVALALERGAPLLTLDAELRSKALHTFPSLAVGPVG